MSTRQLCNLFFAAIICASCTDRVKLNKASVRDTLTHLNPHIESVHHNQWKVGKSFEHKISKSLTLVIKFNPFETEDADYLYKRFGVDSWIVKLEQHSSSQTKTIGFIQVPFNSTNRGRVRGVRQINSVSVNLVYAAAYMSERFRNFKCPAFGHDKIIDEHQLIEIENAPESLNIGGATRLNDKPSMIELTPTDYNMGHSLKGKYLFSMALYNSKSGKTVSEFLALRNVLEVSKEKRIEIASCAGEHPERD